MIRLNLVSLAIGVVTGVISALLLVSAPWLLVGICLLIPVLIGISSETPRGR